MLFSLRSRALFSASIAASLLRDWSVTATPPVFDLAEPVVADDRVAADDPDESPFEIQRQRDTSCSAPEQF